MNLKDYMILAAGVAIGGVAMHFLADKKVRAAEAELDAMQVWYEEKLATYEDKEIGEKEEPAGEIDVDVLKKAATKPPIEEMMAKAEELGYTDYSTENPKKSKKSKKPIEEAIKDLPYIISPSEYAINEEYKNIAYEFYDDGTLVSEDHEVVDAMMLFGLNPADQFDVNPDDPDTFYMRNDTLKIDYEILRVSGDYEG